MIPNYLADVEAAKVKYPDAWAHAHHEGDPSRLEWIKLFANDLHAKDPKVNLNGKRGNPNDLSADAINILCDKADSEGRTPDGLPCVVVDVIGGAGGPNPVPTWNVFTTAVEGSGAPVTPGQTQPQPTPVQPYPDEQTWWTPRFDPAAAARYAKAGKPYPDGPGAFRWASRTAYDIRDGLTREQSLWKHLQELEAELKITFVSCGMPVPGTDGMSTPPIACLLERGHDGAHK